MEQTLKAFQHGLSVLKREADRQKELMELYKNNEESVKHHQLKLRWILFSIKVIEANRDFYLEHPEIFQEDN